MYPTTFIYFGIRIKRRNILSKPISRVDNQGIRTKLLNQEIFFEFAYSLDERNLNELRSTTICRKIKTKENHINFSIKEFSNKSNIFSYDFSKSKLLKRIVIRQLL